MRAVFSCNIELFMIVEGSGLSIFSVSKWFLEIWIA